MSHPALRVAAARHFLGLTQTHPDELIAAAHAALDDGIYSYSLGEIATSREPGYWWDISLLFAAAMRELGLVVSDWEEAIDALAESYLVPLAEGGGVPATTVRQVYSDYAALLYGEHNRRIRGRDLGPLTPFLDMHYRYVETNEYEAYLSRHPGIGTSPAGPTHQEVREQLDAECITLARAWCGERWQPILDPNWLTSTVVALARGISDEKAFDRLPILADALEDTGCANADILAHCRDMGREHVRGCWAVDLLLGRPWREQLAAAKE